MAILILNFEENLNFEFIQNSDLEKTKKCSDLEKVKPIRQARVPQEIDGKFRTSKNLEGPLRTGNNSLSKSSMQLNYQSDLSKFNLVINT